MFKKLRNNFLITNMVIITAFVIGCFSAIYITTYSFVQKDVDMRLNMAVEQYRNSIHRPVREKPENRAILPESAGTSPADDRNRDDRLPPETRGGEPRSDMFRSEISVYCDKSGNIISAQSVFSPDEFDYGDKIKEIATSRKDRGNVNLDVDSWAYMRVGYNDGYIIAFTKNESEQNVMFTLMFVLVFVALISIALSYIISRFSANRSIRPIEEAYNKQKQFIADASHELRTPLASISANTDVLLSKDCNADENKWLTYIKEETERMTNLTNDLLMLAKSDSYDNKIILSEIEFSELLEDSVLEAEATAFERGVELNSDIEANINVLATHSGLKQLVLILIDNAVKYTERGGSINILLKSENGKAVFTVENPGTISAVDLPHIFERFYRADKSRASKGYGLGLAIAKSLCKSFGGSIEAKSLENMTIFKVILNENSR